MRFITCKASTLLCLCLMAASSPAWAASRQTSEIAESAGSYSYRYLCYLPPSYQSDTSTQWPLMVFLHGSGETGTNLDLVAIHGPPMLIEQGRDYPCIVVSPQSTSYGWSSAALDSFIKDLAQKYRVDPNRIYVTGLSMGGYGTWNLATYDPSLCAAIAPICGGGNPSLAYLLKDMPVWAFHGALDPTVSVSQSQAMIDAIRQAGGDPLFTIYPDGGHNVWTVTYADEQLYTWMFAQSRATDPIIVRSPEPVASAVGGYAAFRVLATGSDLSYLWTHNNVAIPGATGADLFLPCLSNGDEGLYRVEISNTHGTVQSTSAELYVGAATDVPRLTALSVRALAGQGERTLIMGLVIKDPGNWVYPAAIGIDGPRLPVLLRGVGSTLAALHVQGAIANPQIAVYDNGLKRSANDNWGGDALVSQLGATKGLEAIGHDSLDAALYETLRPGSYSVHVSPVTPGGDGIALAECYEVNGGLAENTPILHALAARTTVSPGDGTLIAGLIVDGPRPLKVLIRGIGPSLAAQGVAGYLPDPVLSLYAGNRVIAGNDDWGGDEALAEAFNLAGVGSLAPGSADSALLVTLPPGAYTALISSKNGQNGIALVEVYALEGE
ncbi:MAG: PHB depolymerase family esterase [Opitutaceae bacterium]|jgi:predicted esterase